MEIRNKWIDNIPLSEVAEPILGESMTLPDQSMSITEIFQRFALGQNLDIGDTRDPVYGDTMEEYEFDELHDMLPKRDVDEVYDPEDEESSQSSEGEQAPAVPQTDIGKEPAPQVSDPSPESENQSVTAK
nr:MAG TPA: hypothetical protein [Microviridae sp.]